jgi:predicted SprT family Zn-dependent metalloprotease
MEGKSDDELPDLATLLPPRAVSTLGRRQAPRKAPQLGSLILEGKSASSVSVTARKTRASPTKPAKAVPVKKTPRPKPTAFSSSNVPALPRQGSRTEVSASSNNGVARSPPMRSIGIPHVDSLLLPLSKICLDVEVRPRQSRNGSTGLAASALARSDVTQKSKRSDSRQEERSTVGARKFVLSEAACADDFENSLIDEDEDVDTDLSGFIVDDEVEPSIHESSSESEVDRRAKRKSPVSPRKRRLHQGSRHRKNAETVSLDTDSEETAKPNDGFSGAFRDLKIEEGNEERPKEGTEIIDLTSSPVQTHDVVFKANVNTEKFYGSVDFREPANPINLFNDFDAIMKFSPPCSNALSDVPSQLKIRNLTLQGEEEDDVRTSEMDRKDGFTTPPATPQRSPSKLKTPSKLLSPSKRAAQVQHSPHRQSIDGFWDLEVVNTWNDTYSPKKAPITSPRKTRFLEWIDSGDEDEETPTGLSNDTSDSLPSPCSSPRKSKSPQRSPEKAEKQRLLEEKRIAKANKQAFDSRKEQLATSLMADLDTNITSSKLSTLSATTGGVQIIWSKTLRSTAGRANWRRTVVKASGSPVKGASVPEGSKVQHYASIELATKVIDCETRLVNTLAHEFCHLANFMVSNVRDQPHGASFKAWAMKVTKYLRAHNNPMYIGVEVTTKHSYTIDHKYLWVCAGREALGLLKNVPEVEDGCGAEYGRHSKSIDTEKQRCGRCKGALLQVRPKPRRVDPKRVSPRKALFQRRTAQVEAVAEMVEIVDLSD